MIHELKTDGGVFQAAFDWAKNFEIRKDDRAGGFNVGDELRLCETQYTGAEMRAGAPLHYTGREIYRTITYVLRGPAYGLASGWVILSWNWH